MRTIYYPLAILVLLGVLGGPAQAASPVVTLKESVESTLSNHDALKAIQENRQAVLHEYNRARAGYGPRVDLSARFGANHLDNTTTRSLGTDDAMYSAGGVSATLTQPIWDGWATRSRVRSAEATLDSMTSRVLDNATTLALDSVIAHVNLLRCRDILELARKNVSQHREILGATRTLVSSGADTVASVSQAEGRLSRALSTLAAAESGLRDAETAYRRITGRPLPLQLEEVTLPASMYVDAMAVLQDAQASNPKIAAYLADVRAAQGEKELAQSAFYPSFNLEAGPNYSDRGSKSRVYEYSFDVMGTVRWNIFNSGADLEATKAAGARVRQARLNLNNLAEDLNKEIHNSWSDYRSFIEQYRNYADAVRHNITTRNAYRAQFNVGQRSLLDVLDSESELFNSSTQAVTTQSNVVIAGYRLYALAGRLLPVLDIGTANLNDAPAKDISQKKLPLLER